MKKTRIAVVAAATLAAVGWSPSPASADHQTYINATTQTCVAAAEATGIGTTFGTSDYTVKLNKDGYIKRYVCDFSGIPEFIPEQDGSNGARPWPAWSRPTKPTKYDVLCSTNIVAGTIGRGTFKIRPDGTARLTCTFAPAAYYNPYCPPCSPEHPVP